MDKHELTLFYAVIAVLVAIVVGFDQDKNRIIKFILIVILILCLGIYLEHLISDTSIHIQNASNINNADGNLKDDGSDINTWSLDANNDGHDLYVTYTKGGIYIMLEYFHDVYLLFYNAGGSHLRWILWFWVGFAGVYALLGFYDGIHHKDILNRRKKKRTNYYYFLHLYLILTFAFTYGNLLLDLQFYVPIFRKTNAPDIIGFPLIVIGLIFVVLGRLLL